MGDNNGSAFPPVLNNIERYTLFVIHHLVHYLDRDRLSSFIFVFVGDKISSSLLYPCI